MGQGVFEKKNSVETRGIQTFQDVAWSLYKRHSWKGLFLSKSRNFPAFYRNWSFVTVFTKAHNLFLSLSRWYQSTPYEPVPLWSIQMLSIP